MRTTFSRTFFPAAIILLAALLLLGTSFRALVEDFLQDNAVESLRSDATIISELASAYYTEGRLSSRDFLLNLDLSSRVSGADAIICDSTGRVVLCSDSPFGCEHQMLVIEEKYLNRVLQNGIATDTGAVPDLYPDARYIVSVPILDANTQKGVGIVMVSSPLAQTTMVLERISDIYLFVALIVVLVAGVVMTFFARQQSKPLQDMARVANAFGHGDLNARVRLEGDYPQEIEELALAFNNMATSLQKSEYQRQEFVANVSHELKTPMTTIGGYIDGILDGTIPANRSRQYMQIVSDETKRLSRLVRSMLDISRLQDQGGIPDEKKTRFDVEECAGQVLITFEKKIMDKHLDVDVDIPELPTYTYACEDYITQVIYNLLDNAVKFCPEGGTLGLKISKSNTKVFVSVSNDGDTIPADELPLVFDRFHKLDKARNKKDGWGLVD